MRRQLAGRHAYVARALAVALALFQLFTAATAPLPDMQQRALHVLLGFMLTFAFRCPRKKAQDKIPVYDFVFMAIIAAAGLNAFIKYEWFALHIGWTSALDMTLGVALLLLCLEAARRVTGLVFPVLIALSLAYAILGAYIPGRFGHAGFDLSYMIQELYQTTNGMWGYIVGISANIVAMFLIFGAFLLSTGGGEVFINLALWLMGRYRGGPAMAAVIASAFFGTISGSAIANVAGTGNYTIPMMKRLGYRPEFAGAVEATASSGGQIMPPVMGAAAFIMAEWLGIKYTEVAVAAAIPAVLYFAGVLFYVRFEAVRLNLSPVPREEIPPARSFLGWSQLAPFILPIVVMLYLIGTGWSPAKSCFWASVCALAIYFFKDFNWASMKQRVGGMVRGLEKGALSIVEVVSMLVAANIVVDLLTVTGVTVKLSELIFGLGGQALLLGLLLSMVVSIILGTALPTSAAYVLTVAVVGAPLIKLGIAPLAVHMFVFYFGVMSSITPPECAACVVAGAIAQTDWLKVAWIAMRLAAVVYILPFVWMYQPALLMIGTPAAIVQVALTTMLGSLCLSVGFVGYLTSKLRLPTRLLVVAAGILFMMPGLIWSLYGVLLLAAAFVSHRLGGLKKKRLAEDQARLS